MLCMGRALSLSRCKQQLLPPLAAHAMQGVIAQITPVRLGVLEVGSGRSFPPTLFVHMAQRDPEFAASVAEALDFCRWVDGRVVGCGWWEEAVQQAVPYLAGHANSLIRKARVWQSP